MVEDSMWRTNRRTKLWPLFPAAAQKTHNRAVVKVGYHASIAVGIADIQDVEW
jgi:hypothetical protein